MWNMVEIENCCEFFLGVKIENNFLNNFCGMCMVYRYFDF